jgi:hypothetical protein
MDRAVALARAEACTQEAIEINSRILELAPEETAAATRLAACLQKVGRLDESEALCRRVLQRDGRNSVAQGILGRVETARSFPGVDDPRALLARIAPTEFHGFRIEDFAELSLLDKAGVETRFSGRLRGFIERLNALPVCCEELLGVVRERHTAGGVFSPQSSGTQAGHWYLFHRGGRWEAQLNIGMFGAGPWPDNYLRIGLGFNLTALGRDPEGQTRKREVAECFRRFQTLIEGELRGVLTAWIGAEGLYSQKRGEGPDLQRTGAKEIVDWLSRKATPNDEWVFIGKWLSPRNDQEREVLANPELLLSTVERVLRGLLPIWIRAVRA